MIIEKNRYLIRTKILIGNYFGGSAEDCFIELREPSTKELYELKGRWKEADKDYEKIMFALVDLLPSLIVDHNAYLNDKDKYSTQELVELVLSKLDMFYYVVSEYYDKVLFIIMPELKTGEENSGTETKTS